MYEFPEQYRLGAAPVRLLLLQRCTLAAHLFGKLHGGAAINQRPGLEEEGPAHTRMRATFLVVVPESFRVTVQLPHGA